LKASNLF
jgi:hypothetical protein